MRFFRKDLKKRIDELRKKWDIDPAYFFSGEEGAYDDFLRLLDDNELAEDVEKMLHELGIAHCWSGQVHQYVLDDGLSTGDYDDYTVDPDGLKMEVHSNDYVSLHIGPAATFKDLRKAWQIVLDYRTNSSSRVKIKEKASRDVKIYLAHMHGKTAKEISQSVRDIDGEILSEGVINKVISEKKKQHGNR